METKYFLKLIVSGIWKKYLTIVVFFSRITHFRIMHVNLEINFPNIFLKFFNYLYIQYLMLIRIYIYLDTYIYIYFIYLYFTKITFGCRKCKSC